MWKSTGQLWHCHVTWGSAVHTWLLRKSRDLCKHIGLCSGSPWYSITCILVYDDDVIWHVYGFCQWQIWKFDESSPWLDVLQKPVTDGSTISSTTPGLTPERKSPTSSVNSSSALPLPQAEKSKKVRCLLLREANISYSIQIIKRKLINGLSHSDLLRFDISPPVIQSLARLILKLDRGPCFHERNTLSDNNELFLKWIQIIPSTVYRVLIDKMGIISQKGSQCSHLNLRGTGTQFKWNESSSWLGFTWIYQNYTQAFHNLFTKKSVRVGHSIKSFLFLKVSRDFCFTTIFAPSQLEHQLGSIFHAQFFSSRNCSKGHREEKV